MAILKQYQHDVDAILGKTHDNGADFWATTDGRWVMKFGGRTTARSESWRILPEGVERFLISLPRQRAATKKYPSFCR